MAFLSQLCLEETTVNWDVTGDRDITFCRSCVWGDDSELARHRRQGHIPFCLECAKGRSVFQHRRDKGDRKEVSIQADFAFLKTTGKIAADELPGSVEILLC